MQKLAILNPKKKSFSESQQKVTDDLKIEKSDIDLLLEAIETKAGRLELSKTLQGFCFVYLPHYLNIEPADFHPELLSEIDHKDNQFLAVAGFRGCAKSTFASLALPIYKAVKKEFNFIILFGDTAPQARLNIENVKFEFENNQLLRQDFGDFTAGMEKTKLWTQTGLLLNNEVRIIALSRGQKIRGLRHRENRPDLIIIDDPEELLRINTKEYRDKTEKWLTGDVIPAAEEDKSKLIIIANMLHTDSLMARIKSGKIGQGIFKYLEYPLIDKNGQTTWSGKYPNEKSLKRQEAKVGRTAWLREYLLKVVPPDGQEVKDEWIRYYDDIPNNVSKSGVGVDLAISKKQTADFTSMVSGVVAKIDNFVPKIYILPNPTNERLSALETQTEMQRVSKSVKQTYCTPIFYIEDVAYQKAAIELARTGMLPVVGVRPTSDKRARLKVIATYIQQGTILFPKQGCEELLGQLLGFGIEEHDDLVDAFVDLIFGLTDEGIELPEVKLIY